MSFDIMRYVTPANILTDDVWCTTKVCALTSYSS